MSKRIPLSQGMFSLVDDDDYEELSQYDWYAIKSKGTFYAVRNVYSYRFQTTIRMHRQILNAPDGVLVDHENHDGLDNRRKNIRLASHTQNCMNRLPRKNKDKSVPPGVSWTSRDKRWQAYIGLNGKQIKLGNYKTLEDAIKARRQAEERYFKEYAYKRS